MKNKHITRANIVIIGGGIQGLSVAYHLALKGADDILVLEQRYLGSGNSERCFGGIRAQHPTEEEIQIAKLSLKMWETLSGKLNFNIFFRQAGYLYLVYSEEEVEEHKKLIELHNSLNVRSRYVTVDEIKKLAPALDLEGIKGGRFHAKDGIAFPFAAIWAFANKFRKSGGEIWTYSKVTDIEVRNGRIYSVIVDDKVEIKTNIVINAAGIFSGAIAQMVNLEHPTRIIKHEALVTEPLKPFLDPLVISRWGPIVQTQRGEVIGSYNYLPETDPENLKSTKFFMEKTAWYMAKVIPRLRKVKVIRQWAGHYDETPDKKPIIGEIKVPKGYFESVGWRHNGFMLAPVVGKLLADLIIRGKKSSLLEPFRPDRF